MNEFCLGMWLVMLENEGCLFEKLHKITIIYWFNIMILALDRYFTGRRDAAKKRHKFYFNRTVPTKDDDGTHAVSGAAVLPPR